jgi:hypothetical protein
LVLADTNLNSRGVVAFLKVKGGEFLFVIFLHFY